MDKRTIALSSICAIIVVAGAILIYKWQFQYEELPNHWDELKKNSEYIPFQKTMDFGGGRTVYIEGIVFMDNNRRSPAVLFSSDFLHEDGHNIEFQCLEPEITGGGGTHGYQNFHTKTDVEDKLVLNAIFIENAASLKTYKITIDLKNRAIYKH